MKPNNINSIETQDFASLQQNTLQNMYPRNASLPQQQEPGTDTPKYKDKYRIETTRLKSWDYGSNGYYFVTICVKNRECALGCIENGAMTLSDMGMVTHQCWQEIPAHFPFVCLDEFIVMPNHVHGILIIDKPFNMNPVETQDIASLQRHNPESPQNGFGPQSKNLASIIRGFKIGVKKWATLNNISFYWQPRYHDHIIRNEAELGRIREYIATNPLNWETDENYEC